MKILFKIALTLAVLLNICNPAFSQNNVDSLKLLLENATKEEKFNLSITISDALINTNPEESIKFAEEAVSIAKSLKNKTLEADGLYHLAMQYNALYKDNEALEHFIKAYEIRKTLDDNAKTAEVLNNIGLSYYYIGDFENSKKHCQEALTLASKIKNDKEQANALFTLGYVARKEEKPRDAINYFKASLELFLKISDDNGIAKVHNSIGLIYNQWNKNDSAIYHYEQTLIFKEKVGDKRGEAITLNNIGNIYLDWSKYDKAIDYYQRALKIFEEVGYKEGISSCLNNIGLIYNNLKKGDLHKENLENYSKALDFFLKALKVNLELNNDQKIADTYNNIGTVYAKIQETKLKSKHNINLDDWIFHPQKDTIKLQDINNAYESYQKALEIYTKIGYSKGIASCLNNLGRIKGYWGQYSQSVADFEKALEISRQINDKSEESLNLFQLGTNYKKLKKYEQALDYLLQALEIANLIHYNEMRKSCFEQISEVYEQTNQPVKALSIYKRFIGVKDSIFNEENYKLIANLQTKYETEKTEQALKQAQERDTLSSKIIKQQRLLIYAFILVFIIIVGFSILIFRQNNQIKKKNDLLAEQNDLISKQKEEITDSIHYASRIQRALLPHISIMEKNLQDFFILWRPRDIVSGDFYWFNEHLGKLIVVASDCTGHGVPGAFMSMLGVSFLNEIVTSYEDITADKILNELRSKIMTSLHQTGKEGESKDGMDMSLYILDKTNMKLEFAGANNPLVIIRGNEIIQLKADKMPIGIYVKSDIPFKSEVVDLLPGDCIYTFSDGFQDQFGGPDRKKFMIKRMKELFVEIHEKPMQKQREILNETIFNWMGKNDHNQIDDILVVGVKV